MKQDNPAFKQIVTHAFKRMVYEDSYEDRMANKQEFGRASQDHETTVRNLRNNMEKLDRILANATELASLIGIDSRNADAAAEVFDGYPYSVEQTVSQLQGIYNALRTGDPKTDTYADEFFK